MKTPEEIKKGLECCAADGFEVCDDCPYLGKDCNEMVNLKDALAYIQQLEAQVQKWINVDERFPDEHARVLIAVRYEDDIRIHTTGFSGGAWHVTLLDCEHVTHWMPLPEPPKEADDDHTGS